MRVARVLMAVLLVILLVGYTSAIVLKEYQYDLQMNELESTLKTYQRRNDFMTNQIKQLERAKKSLNLEIRRKEEELAAKQAAVDKIKAAGNAVTGVAVSTTDSAAAQAEIQAQKELAAKQAAAKRAEIQAKLDAARKAAQARKTTTRKVTTSSAS